MRDMDVVIVSYAKNNNCHKLTVNSLISLGESEEDVNFNVVVVESQPDIYWEGYHKPNMTIETIRPDTSYGYHKYLNLGRKKGISEFVALCNNDLIFKKNWASKIFQASEYNPNYLSFSPICPKTQPQYGIQINSGLIKGYVIRQHISGWCIVQKRSIYNIIGDLDENFIHWYSDNDYAMTLQKFHIDHMIVTTSIVEHHNNIIGKTTKEIVTNEKELYSLTYEAQDIFSKKWGS